MSSTSFVGVCGVLDSGSLRLCTSASARLNGVGVRGASPFCRCWLFGPVGENLESLGVLWADAWFSCPGSGVFKMETWPRVRWTVVTGVDWALGGKWVEVAILECVGVEVRLPAMSKDMFGLRRNWKFKWLITRSANLMRYWEGEWRDCVIPAISDWLERFADGRAEAEWGRLHGCGRQHCKA